MFDLPLCHAYFLPHLAVLISAFPLFHDNSWLLLVRLLTLWETVAPQRFPASRNVFYSNQKLNFSGSIIAQTKVLVKAKLKADGSALGLNSQGASVRSQSQFGDLPVQQHILFPSDSIIMVMPEKPVSELTPLGYLVQKIRQVVGLECPAAQFILYRGGAAVGDDVIHRRTCPGWPGRSGTPPRWAAPPPTRSGGSPGTVPRWP